MSAPLRLVFDPQGDLRDAAVDCEAEVFLSWYGNTREQLADEYGPYEDSSAFLAVADEGGDVLAAVRFLAPGGLAGLKTLRDVGSDPWHVDGDRAASAVGMDLTSTWEVATLGARRGVGGGSSKLALALYHGLMNVARANEMSTCVAILDERVRRLLNSVGMIMHALPGTRPGAYLGSDSSLPVWAHYANLRDNQRRNHPDAYRLVTLGAGLDGVSVPPIEHFRLARPIVRRIDLTQTVGATVGSSAAYAAPSAARLQEAVAGGA